MAVAVKTELMIPTPGEIPCGLISLTMSIWLVIRVDGCPFLTNGVRKTGRWVEVLGVSRELL